MGRDRRLSAPMTRLRSAMRVEIRRCERCDFKIFAPAFTLYHRSLFPVPARLSGTAPRDAGDRLTVAAVLAVGDDLSSSAASCARRCQ